MEAVVHGDEAADMSTDASPVMGNGHSRSEFMQQQTMDLEILKQEIAHLLLNIKLRHDKKTDSFDIIFVTEKRRTNVHKEELVLVLGGLNSQSANYINEENWYACLCELNKGIYFSNVVLGLTKEFQAVYPDIKEFYEWSLIFTNNIGFVYWKMGVTFQAIEHLERLLSGLKLDNSHHKKVGSAESAHLGELSIRGTIRGYQDQKVQDKAVDESVSPAIGIRKVYF